MKWPWQKIIEVAGELVDIVRRPTIPRCLVDGSKYHKVGETSDGAVVYECEFGHTYSPAVGMNRRADDQEKQ